MSVFDNLSKLLPFLASSSQAEFYFALNIEKSQVQGSVWGILGKKLEIINSAQAGYSSEEHLLEMANLVLDEALADFQPEPTKVLFGVPDYWLQDEDLKPEKLKLLKKLVHELDITPMAYVSTTSAISHFLQKQQGVPLTGILVEAADPLVVTVIKAGKSLGTKELKRTDNLPEDIEKCLLHFTDIEVLPSKILIYGSEKEDKLKEELQGYSWMAQLPFLHLPKIEELPKNIILHSICLAGASELHADISFNTKIADVSIAEVLHERHSAKTLDIEDEKEHLKDSGKNENFDFIAGDIEQNLEKEPEEEMHHPVVKRHHQEEDFTREVEQNLETGVSKFGSLIKAPLGFLAKKDSHPHVQRKGGVFPGKVLLIGILLILLLIGAFVFLPKAKVTVFIDLRVLEKESQVVADPKVSQIDEGSNIIPGKIVDVSVADLMKGQASGKKQIGDPAKGKVVIYNKTNSPKSISSGTILTGANNLKFALDTSVSVASQSSSIGADFTTTIKPGRSDPIGATASNIGPDGNIGANTELAVAGFSSDQVVARVDAAFSGGISKNVTVVTVDDQKKLLASLATELRKKAKEQIQGKLTGDQKVLEEGLAEEIVKKTYSKNVNDQATEFNLNLTAKYSGTSYSDTDLKTIVSKLVETNVPSGYSLDLSKTETQADVSKIEKDGRLIFLAKFRAKLMPKLETDQIKKEIAFKTPPEVAEKLKAIENVIGSNIELSPTIPIPALQRLPFLPSNITIEVTAK